MEHPKAIGDRCTLAVMLALQARGYTLSLPFGENARYDMVADDGGSFARVQCKSGRLRNGAVEFNTCSCYGHHRNPGQARRQYDGQIDFFGVYCPDTAAVYFVPIADVRTRSCAKLRVEPPRNNQRKRIRFARDYVIARLEA